jgi:uncharacterized repeat protein (TIGR01451 family)
MTGKLARSRAWLFWTGIFLAGAMLAVALAGGLKSSQALSPIGDIEISKAVNMPSAAPGQAPAPLYTITITNPGATELILEAITDTLPSGFVFIDMHPTSGWQALPDDVVEPEIAWHGPITIAASGALSLCYSVDTISVAPSTTPYVNRVEAMTSDGTPVGPASAPLLIGVTDLSVQKEAWPTRVLNGEPVTYTVVFANGGHLTGTVETISDTLDPRLTFVGMIASSDVMTPPQNIAGTLVWKGPFDVPALGDLTLRYQVQTPGGSTWHFPFNRVVADARDGTLGPAETRITVGPEKAYVYLPAVIRRFTPAYFTVSKSAFPTTVTTNAGEVVTYTVTIKNEGDTPGTLSTVYDTLPPGFSYIDMAASSDVQADPAGTQGTITWSGPWTMPSGSQKRLVYLVSASQTEGQYTNYANVTSPNAPVPDQPASATVIVERGILLEDHFESGTKLDQWTEFLNYKYRLAAGQWYWGANDGYLGTGAATQDAYRVDGKEAEDALLMYLGPGAEEWTDYRVETKIIFRTNNYPHGLWVRGQYEDVGDDDPAGWVTGYYIMVGGSVNADTHFVSLKQMQTEDDCWDQACNNPGNLYDFNNPHELTITKKDGKFERHRWYTIVVEVRGANIQVWLDGVKYIDYNDTKEPFLTGTIGLKTFKANTVSFDDVLVTPLN